jgi:hypothetical protein
MRGLYGEFYVVAYVGAIYTGNLWQFINALCGIASQDALQTIIDAKDKEYAEQRAQWDIERQRQEQERAAQLELAASQVGLPKLAALPKGEGEFVRLNYKGELWLYVIRKKAFGQLCYTSIRYADGVTAAQVDTAKKMKRWEDRRASVEQSLAAGHVFATH